MNKHRTCKRCGLRGGFDRNRALCESCRNTLARYGLRWCGWRDHEGLRDVPARDYARNCCHTCHVRYHATRYHTQRGQPAAPPPGHISIAEAARRSHYSVNTLLARIKRGTLTGWRRGPRSAWYVRLEAVTRPIVRGERRMALDAPQGIVEEL